MARKNRLTKYNILIVCEGTNTEPNYFQGLWEEIQKHRSEIFEFHVEISPKPKLDSSDINENQEKASEHKSKRKKRKLLWKLCQI